MNPFDLRGPQFLLFYAVLTVVLIYVTRRVRMALDGDHPHPQPTSSLVSDPYLIAHLRGGAKEAVRVALLSLIDRGLIVYDGGKTLKTAAGVTPEHGRRAIEQAALRLYADGATVNELPSLESTCEEYTRELQRLRFFPDDALNARRKRLRNVMLLIAGGVGGVKMIVGLQRGRPIAFLVIAVLVALLLISAAAMANRTKHGDAFLQDVRRLFSGLRSRAGAIRVGGGTAELALLAAAFGVWAVPSAVFPQGRHLFAVQSTSSQSSSGSSCGSSSGSSCGSSCGGGGGGCGGCGS
ncbi:MAG TPA: TIGR04222 domain-containing membrane protein [Thermoanaerobaculia bacterium]